MIKVYFEDKKHISAEVIATFETEELYMTCLPALEKWAEDNRGVITESVEDIIQLTN